MYCHYIGWCIEMCPLYRGVLYSECPLSEVPLYTQWMVTLGLLVQYKEVVLSSEVNV